MKKIVYLAPALLLGLVGKGVMADQNTHISHLDAGFMTSLNESQLNQAADANRPVQEQAAQSKNIKTSEAKKTTSIHISSLDSGIIEGNAKTNEIRHTAATNVNSLDNNSVENNTKAVQYNTFSVKANTKIASDFAESKVTNGDSNQHTIRNPNRDQITIHYVTENGKSIAGLKDYTININNAPKGNSTGQFKVPDNRYVLPDPTGDYQLQHDKHNVHHNAVTHTVHHPEQGHEESYEIPGSGHYETVQTDQIDHWEYSDGNGGPVTIGTGKATTHISSLDSSNVIYNTLNVSSRNKFATYTNFAESKQVAANDNSEKYSVVNDINNHNYSVNNPNQNKVIIHYVDENGKSISGLKDYTIDLTKQPQGTTTGQFNVPDNRYVLPDPNKQYDITNLRKTIHHNAITHVVHHPEETHVVHHEATGHSEATGTQWIVTGSDGDTDVFDDDMNNHTPGDSMWGTGSGNPGDTVVSATPSTTYTWVEDSPAYDETVIDRNAWDETVTDRPAYNETKGPTTFAENNTLNIKSIVGNTVNVILKHGTRNVDANNSDIELDSWRKVHVINSDNQNNLTNKSVKFKVGYTLDMVSLAKIANFNSSKALTNPNDFIGENKLTDPVGFSAINTKLLSISL